MSALDGLMVGAGTRVLVVLHYYATGPGQELHQWLAQSRGTDAALLEHPFPFSNRTTARWLQWRDGAFASERHYRRSRLPTMPFRYALDFLRTIRLVIAERRTYDWYIGNGSFDTLPGIVLRWLGCVRHVILYTIDYAPEAAGTAWYAWLYRHIDRFCCRHADAVWNLSPRMHDARVAVGMNADRCAPVVTVPHGTHAASLRPTLPAAPEPGRVAFMGHVLDKSGVHLFVETMPALAVALPSLHLDILGDGPYVPELKRLAAECGVADRIAFHGYIADHAELERRLACCGIGLALYTDQPGDFTRTSDPGKPKVYMACGLPVLITNVPAVAAEIGARGAGVIVEPTRAGIQAGILRLAGDHARFRAAALAMADEFDWLRVFDRACAETADVLKCPV